MKYNLFYENGDNIIYEDIYDLLDDHWTLDNFGEEFDEFLDDSCQTIEIPYYGQAEVSYILKKLDMKIYEERFNSFMDIYADYVISYLRNEYEMPLPNGMKIVRIDDDEE